MKASSIYKFGIALLIVAILVATGAVFKSLFSARSETSTPRTAVERLLYDATLAVKYNPNSVEARISLASALAESGNYKAALEQGEFVEKLDPKNADLALLRGTIYSHMGRQNQAIKYLKDAAADKDQLVDFYSQVYTELAASYEDINQLKEAVKANQEALRYFPVSETNYENLGRLYEKLGQASYALDSYQSALTFDAKNETCLQGVERLKEKVAQEKKAAQKKEAQKSSGRKDNEDK
jgi:tetratricopeptide (TPR) repeat protein